MKKTYLFLALLTIIAAFTFSSCQKIKEKVFEAFTLNGANYQFQIPVVPNTNEMSLGVKNVNFNVDSAVRAATAGVFSTDIVDEVTAEEATLTLLDADANNNLSNFERVQIKVSTSGSSSPIIIATVTPGTNTYDVIDLQTDGSQQLKNLLKSSSISYEVVGKARKATTKPLNAELVVRLKFK